MAVLSSTLTILRQGFLNYIGETYRGTTTANGAADGSTFIDTTKLVNFSNNKFQFWWAYITSGTYAGQERRVASSAQTGGTVTGQAAFGGQILSGVTYELCRYQREEEVLTALNWGLRECFPSLHVSRVNDTLISGNALPNSSFEDWTASSAPDLWTATTVTAAKETSVKLYGAASLKVTGAASAGHVACTNSNWPPLLDLMGQSIDFEAWVKTDTASHARLQIVDDDGNTLSSYHTGGNTWELLKATRGIKSGTKSDGCRCCGDVNGAVAYFDHARAMGMVVSTYVLPLDFAFGPPMQVFIQSASRTLSGNERACDELGFVWPYQELTDWKVEYSETLGLWLLRLRTLPPDGYKIRLVGPAHYTDLSAETDTVALEGSQALLLYPVAAHRLFSMLVYNSSGQAKAEYEAKAQKAAGEAETAKRKFRMDVPTPYPSFGDWRW